MYAFLPCNFFNRSRIDLFLMKDINFYINYDKYSKNSVQLIGKIGRDVELVTFDSGMKKQMFLWQRTCFMSITKEKRLNLQNGIILLPGKTCIADAYIGKKRK